MGLLDSLTGMLGGNTPQGGGSGLLSSVLNMVNDPGSGGLQGLVQAFHDKGLGGIAASWVGTGTNLPINADQITQALGDGKIAALAKSHGIDASAVASQLASLLPNVVDKLTPNGSIPDNAALSQGLTLLRQTLGAGAGPTSPTS